MDLSIDGELGPNIEVALAEHLAACADCRTLFNARQAMAHRLKTGLDRFTPSDEFKVKLRAQLEESSTVVPLSAQRPHRTVWWAGGAGAGIGAAMAASIAFFLIAPPPQNDVTKELVAAHVRSLMANHLTDVVSSDQHTVKPWFNGRVDLSPPVPDLSEQGYPLVGGRLDYIHERTVAALVYRRRQHLINLFVWPEPDATAQTATRAQRNGYNVVEWRQDGVAFAMVSDVNPQDMDVFRRLWTSTAGLAENR